MMSFFWGGVLATLAAEAMFILILIVALGGNRDD